MSKVVFRILFLLALALSLIFIARYIPKLDEDVMILLALGALGGFIVFPKPMVLLWFTSFMTLVIAGTIGYFYPHLKILQWVSYGTAFLLFLPSLMAFPRRGKNVSGRLLPVLMALLVSLFVLVVFCSTVLSDAPGIQVVVACKSLLMYGGIWAFFAFFHVKDKDVLFWLKGLLAVGLFQIIPVAYQFFFIRAWRVQHTLFKVESADAVVGTFGGFMDAGGLSAVLVTYLVCCILVLLAIRQSGNMDRTTLVSTLFVLGLPIIFAEVKAVYLYLPAGIFLLYRENIVRKPVRFIAGTVVVFIVLAGLLASLQSIHYRVRGEDWKNNLKGAFSYSFRSQIEHGKVSDKKLTRLGAIEFWWQEHKNDDYLEAIIGHGLGASRTQGQIVGHVAEKHAGRMLDLSGLTVLLWDTGLLGVACFVGILVLASFRAKDIRRHLDVSEWKHGLAQGLQAIIPLFIVSLPYRNDIPYAATMMFIVMTVLGLVSWLGRTAKIGP